MMLGPQPKLQRLQQGRRSATQIVRRQHSHTRIRLSISAQVFQTERGSWVVTPPRNRKAKGICHFVGGAFAGAAPQVLYSLLLDLVAASGYTTITTPYAVTFRHLDCAKDLRQQLLDSVDELRASGQAQLVPEDVPIFGLGHSNGALMHLLIGCLFPGPTRSNVLISYNNKQVKDAIPIPGLLDNLGPALQAARNSPLPLSLLPSSSQLLQQAASMLPPFLMDNQAGQLSRAALALDQIGMVFNEVGDGMSDFTPSPAESRRIIAESYSVDSSLLVRFTDDTIDESPEMEQILRSRFPQGVSSLMVPGSHITPCGSDLRWPTGPVYTPVDAVLQLAKMQSQQEVRSLARQVTGWMDAML